MPGKRKFSKIAGAKRGRKPKAQKAAETKKREAYISGVAPRCPRCGETVAIVLERTSTAGVRRYRCFSEECKKNSVRPGRGRGFTVPLGRENCKRS